MEIKKDEDILFLIHQHADPDALGSAYFLQKRWGGTVASPTGPNGTGKNLLTFLGLELKKDIDIDGFDRIFVLDTPDPAQLEPYSLPEKKRFVIDHHKNSSWDEEILSDDRTSCCEIVYDLVEPDDLTEKEGVGLIAGILTDTSSLKRGDAKTFSTLSEIMKSSGVSLDRVRSVLFERRSYSEKIARLKGAKRATHHEVNGFIIATTNIGAFEGSVSSYLLEGGADIAFSGSEKDESFRISGRADNEIVEQGLDIGGIFQVLSKEDVDVSGGGHPGAAVLTGEGALKTYLDKCIERVYNEIDERGLGKQKD